MKREFSKLQDLYWKLFQSEHEILEQIEDLSKSCGKINEKYVLNQTDEKSNCCETNINNRYHLVGRKFFVKEQ